MEKKYSSFVTETLWPLDLAIAVHSHKRVYYEETEKFSNKELLKLFEDNDSELNILFTMWSRTNPPLNFSTISY